MAYEKAAGILLYNPVIGKFGVAKRSIETEAGGTFSPVGGGLEPGENYLQAIYREFKEEMGIDLTSRLGDILTLDVFSAPENSKFTYVTFVGVLEHPFTEEEIQLNHENDDFVWFDWNNPPTPMHPGFAETMNKPHVTEALRRIHEENENRLP